MKRIRCSCLIVLKERQLLLVRVRNNLKWYLPGGKIELNETPQQALEREVAEELNIILLPQSIHYLTTIIGHAYLQDGEVELICFSARWRGDIIPCAEISEVGYLDWHKRELLAPAVCKFCDEWLSLQNEGLVNYAIQ